METGPVVKKLTTSGLRDFFGYPGHNKKKKFGYYK